LAKTGEKVGKIKRGEGIKTDSKEGEMFQKKLHKGGTCEAARRKWERRKRAAGQPKV